jgi:hypothetical protein
MGIIYSTLTALTAVLKIPHQCETAKWIRIPDTLAHWPWPRAINPHYEECEAESNAWLQSFNVFSPKAQAAFDRCEFGEQYLSILASYTSVNGSLIGLLASLGYPNLNKGISPLAYGHLLQLLMAC